MKLVALPAVLALSLAPLLQRARPGAPAAGQEADRTAALEQLGFLEGRWVLDDGEQYVEETWSPAREDALVGMLRWARGGSVWLYELMSIEADDEHGLVFRLRHFDRGLVPWEQEAEGPMAYPLLSVGENEVVFEDLERDPVRITYRRSGDELHAILAGEARADGRRDEHAFRFRRAE